MVTCLKNGHLYISKVSIFLIQKKRTYMIRLLSEYYFKVKDGCEMKRSLCSPLQIKPIVDFHHKRVDSRHTEHSV